MVHDGGRLRVDLHLYEELDDGRIHYGSVVDGDRVDAADLDGTDRILDTATDEPGTV